VNRVAQAIVEEKTRIIDIDLSAYLDNVQHYLLLEKVARRVDDDEVMQLLKTMRKATGKKGVPQGGVKIPSPFVTASRFLRVRLKTAARSQKAQITFCVRGVISPLLSNVYLTEVDRRLEKAMATTTRSVHCHVQYARFADDLVILVDSHPRHDWLVRAVEMRLREELTKLRVAINEEKSRMVDLVKGEKFSFLGFEFRRILSRNQKWRAHFTPKLKKRTVLLAKLREIFQRFASQPVGRVIALINPILRGWVNYFAVGHSSRCFSMIEDWVEKKIRRHMMRVRQRKGFGWKRWSSQWLYETLGLFHEYRVQRGRSAAKALPA
jgi:RNA-directed DNA polymerase